ncbi:conjugal transfer protein TrbI [Cyanobium sp. NIES-981]|uniref:conjugal transfer protein TrbI n=1 Tax=Cyanobium sp. NIES-981 TaxID=1851505 RepID=UPI0007DCD42F|nr:conjugal transfer protein TrbI [Cyanobium sp. NIES-981]SBO42122.1 Metallothionein [Cyanobium sp. NIES-981]
MAPTPCACPSCTCAVSPGEAVVRNNLAYCCEACASGHPNHEPCHGASSAACGCPCGS